MDELISRQAAIDALIAEARNVDSRYISAERIIHESDAIEVISMLPSAQQWVPVSDGSPKENGKYLVSVKKSEWGGSTIHSVRTMTYNKKEVAPFEWGHYEIYSGKVIAWMPLPEPYEEVNE